MPEERRKKILMSKPPIQSCKFTQSKYCSYCFLHISSAISSISTKQKILVEFFGYVLWKKIICLEIHYRENNTSNDMKKRNSLTEQRKNDKGIKICALKEYSERNKSVSPFWIFVRGLYFDMGFWDTFHFKLLGN